VFEDGEYHFFAALAQAARHASLSTDERPACEQALARHATSLEDLAANNAASFGPKVTLVAAEMARIEGREADAQSLYEHAIRGARDSELVQIEALAFELAARFYADRGLEIVSYTLLRNARACYERWGAVGKVRLLERRHPSLRDEPSPRLSAISLENAYLYADLRERESRIRGLIDSNVVGICFWACGGRILDANEAFARLVGFSREELLSNASDWRTRTPPEYHARDEQWLEDLRSGKAAAPYEKEYVRRDGTRVPVLVGGALLQGEQEQGVAFVVDLTERRHAEQEGHARRLAEAANRAKGEFLAMMSHELRTPLNGILGYAQILLRDSELSARQRQSATVIRHSGEHLLTLINDVLDLAKIEAGKMAPDCGPLQLAAFLRGIHEIILVQAQEKAVTLAWQTAPDLPTAVRADERRLRQVLLNLLGNAVKFTDRGQISLLVTCASPGRLRFEVRDSGIGIGTDQLGAIFQPFEQVGGARLGLRGTGLGLAISRQLVRLMGGEIRVESRLAAGSLFWFEVDVQLLTIEPASSVPPGVMTGYEGPRKTVLVIDDVPENRSMLVDLLAPLGFGLIEAADGREALDRARQAPADLVLTDFVMPEMDGWETTRRLRELPGMARVPAIIVSADASGVHGPELLAAGADAFLSKPIDAEELLGKIVTLLKLEPTYAALPGGHPLEQRRAAQLVVPPSKELELLHRLAEEGDMRQIIRWAERVIQLDERYGPFTDQVRDLARQYQSRAVLSLVEQHLSLPKA